MRYRAQKRRWAPDKSPGISPGKSPGKAELGAIGRRFVAEAVEGAAGLRKRFLDLVHDVRVRDDIDTARVRLCEGRFLLEISPRFVAECLPSSEDKRFVLMHEVAHLERGDLFREGRMRRRFPRLVNLGMDIFVNGSVLGSRYFDEREPRVLDRCYDPCDAPFCLLLPPWRLLISWSKEVPEAARNVSTARYVVMHRAVRWTDEGGSPPRPVLDQLVSATTRVMDRVGFRDAREAARLYLGGWTRTMPFGAFLDRLQRLFDKEGLLGRVEGRPLFLEHDLEALGEALDKAGRQPGFGSEVAESGITPAPAAPSAETRCFYQAVRAALVADPSSPTLRRDADVTFPSVMLHLGRREASLLAAGVFPILSHAPSKAIGLSDERVHLYLDVSGSMDDTLAFVTGLVLTVGELVGSPVYQFSNRVAPITWDDLQAGKVVTTGGTDLDCVALHARKEGHRRILIVTDGHVQLDDDSTRILRREVETFVVIVGWHEGASDVVARMIKTFARAHWVMPPP